MDITQQLEIGCVAFLSQGDFSLKWVQFHVNKEEIPRNLMEQTSNGDYVSSGLLVFGSLLEPFTSGVVWITGEDIFLSE